MKFDMPMWVVYVNPTDCPGHFVVRQWSVGSGGSIPGEITSRALVYEEAILKGVPENAVKLQRDEFDDPCIMEVWL